MGKPLAGKGLIDEPLNSKDTKHFRKITFCCESFVNKILRDCAIITRRRGRAENKPYVEKYYVVLPYKLS